MKIDLPRIPFAPDFKAFADAGRKLAELHLNHERGKEHPLKKVVTPGVPLSYVVADKMKLNKDKTELRINDSLTTTGIPPKMTGGKKGTQLFKTICLMAASLFVRRQFFALRRRFAAFNHIKECRYVNLSRFAFRPRRLSA